jgi:hypothetical protein
MVVAAVIEPDDDVGFRAYLVVVAAQRDGAAWPIAR